MKTRSLDSCRLGFVLAVVLFVGGGAAAQEAPKPSLFRSMNYVNSEEGSFWIDAWRAEVMKSPLNAGLIIVYGGQNGKRGETAAHICGIKQAFYTKSIDLQRSPVIDGGYRERVTVEFWVIPPGAETPRPTPTIDKKAVRFKGVLRRNAVVAYECCG